MSTEVARPSPADLPASVGRWRLRVVRQYGHTVVPTSVTDADRTIINSRRDKDQDRDDTDR